MQQKSDQTIGNIDNGQSSGPSSNSMQNQSQAATSKELNNSASKTSTIATTQNQPKMAASKRERQKKTSDEICQTKKNMSKSAVSGNKKLQIGTSDKNMEMNIVVGDHSPIVMGSSNVGNINCSQSENNVSGARKIQNDDGSIIVKEVNAVESDGGGYQHQTTNDNIEHPYNQQYSKSFGPPGSANASRTNVNVLSDDGSVKTRGGTGNQNSQTNIGLQHQNKVAGSTNSVANGSNHNEQTPTNSKTQHGSNTHQSFLSTGMPNTAQRGRVNSNSRQQAESKKKRKSSDKRPLAKKSTNEMPAVNTRSNSRGTANSNNIPKDNHPPQFYDQAQNQFNPFMQNFPFSGPPQVHFIAKKQQFIAQISPEQLMNGDKRPYTAQQIQNLSQNVKRAGGVYNMSKNNVNAFQGHPSVYLGNVNNQSKTHTGGFGIQNLIPGQNHKYSNSMFGEENRPKIGGKDILNGLSSSTGFSSGYHSDPYSSNLPNTVNNTGVSKKQKVTRMHAREKEALYDETIKMKMLNNQLRDDAVKMKTRIKILENEVNRKEKTIEDLFSHNQVIQNQKQGGQSNSNYLPGMANTAQKYQQETFLVMSLKKQIKELKYEVVRREEELEVLRKNIKVTKTKELEQEIVIYREECLRLRSIMEDLIKQGSNHPIYQQQVNQNLQGMTQEIAQKDAIIQQLSERLQQIQSKIDNSMMSASQNLHGSVHPMESSPSATDIQRYEQPTLQTTNTTGGMVSQLNRGEKSADRAIKGSQNNQSNQGLNKEVSRDLQRAKRNLKEKDKELAKLKIEVHSLKKERDEGSAYRQIEQAGTEGQLKNLKEKLKESKTELKKRDERFNDLEGKLKKFEEQLKSKDQALKNLEENSKQLKDKLKFAEKESKKNSQNPTPQQTIQEKANEKTRPQEVPVEEFKAMTLIAQREKLSRDDITGMILSGEEALRMLIRNPSEKLINFIKSNLENEDGILLKIPRYEVPRTDFEHQVLREMKIVLRENSDKIADFCKEETLEWQEFEKFYNSIENFDYPHKDKLLQFIKYFFLDHIQTPDRIFINFQSFKEHIDSKKPINTAERTRNDSTLKSRRRSGESAGSVETEAIRKKINAMDNSEDTPGRAADEDRMLDVAEQCFMRIADLLHSKRETVRQAFGKYAQEEPFKDGTVLELVSPRGFIMAVKEAGFDDITETEAACLMKVLAKPELDGAIILNEFVLIMENFGIPPISEEEEHENDYDPDTEDEQEMLQIRNQDKDKYQEILDELKGKKDLTLEQRFQKSYAQAGKSRARNPIMVKFEDIHERALKVLKKLARFLLERYMHPREFFGPTIKKEIIGNKKRGVEIIKLNDFYLRLKLASIRKKLKEKPELNQFLSIYQQKYPGLVHVKKLIKTLEIIAEAEQEVLIKEQAEKEKIASEKKVKDEDSQDPSLTPKSESDKSKTAADSIIGKDAAATKVGGEMLQISGLGKSAKDSKSLGLDKQLNTIEEDLHETQTSHYSQQLKDGDNTDRDGATSRHQLSTSNHLRNSNAMGDFDESARQSIKSGFKGSSSRSHKNSIRQDTSGEQYDGGIISQTSPKRESIKMRIEQKNEALSDQQINDITDFDVALEIGVKPTSAITKEQIEAEAAEEEELLESEVDKKYQQQIDDQTNNPKEESSDDEEDYAEDLEYIKREYGLGIDEVNQHETAGSIDNARLEDEYREDTIKTDKIEQIIEEDMKHQSRFMKMGSGLNGSIDDGDESKDKGALTGAQSTKDMQLDIRKQSQVFNSAKNSINGGDDDSADLPRQLNKNINEMRQSANIVSGGSQNLMIQDEHGFLVHGDGAATLGISVLEQNEKEALAQAIQNQGIEDSQQMQSEIEEDYEI